MYINCQKSRPELVLGFYICVCVYVCVMSYGLLNFVVYRITKTKNFSSFVFSKIHLKFFFYLAAMKTVSI